MSRIVVSDTREESNRRIREAMAEEGLDSRVELLRSPEAVAAAAEDAVGIVVDASTPVTAEALAAAEGLELEVVARAGIGVDNIDLEAAADHGVSVVNVPDYAVEEVSTHAVGLLLACVRKIPTYDRDTRAGGWDWKVGRPLRRLHGRTVAVVGLGRIGRRFARKLRGFGLDVLGYDPYLDADEFPGNVEPAAFDDALDRADYLSLHPPLTDETRDLIDRGALGRLGDGAENPVLINTSRGEVVDEAALVDALDDGTVDAAGLDVMREEPPEGSPLVGRDDVVITPHAAWYSLEAGADLAGSLARDIRRVLDGREPRSDVSPEQGW